MKHDEGPRDHRDHQPEGRLSISFALIYGVVLPSAFLMKAGYYSHSRGGAMVFAVLGVGLLLDAYRQASTTLDREGGSQWSLFRRRRLSWREIVDVRAGPRFVILRARQAQISFFRWRFRDDDTVVRYVLRMCGEAHGRPTSGDAPGPSGS